MTLTLSQNELNLSYLICSFLPDLRTPLKNLASDDLLELL